MLTHLAIDYFFRPADEINSIPPVLYSAAFIADTLHRYAYGFAEGHTRMGLYAGQCVNLLRENRSLLVSLHRRVHGPVT
jgi:hypothetical protein